MFGRSHSFLVGLVFCATSLGCSGSTARDNAPADASGADASSPGPTGTPGSHVWFDSSNGIVLKESWFQDTWGPDAGPPLFGCRSWSLDRSALSSAQLEALDAIVLVPLTNNCTADGYDYHELTVRDQDGSSAAYRDTGCSSLKLADAKAMLPLYAFPSSAFPLESAAACP